MFAYIFRKHYRFFCGERCDLKELRSNEGRSFLEDQKNRMNIIKVYLMVLMLWCMFLPLATVFSATSNFTVATFVGGDTTPPSVPISLTATPIAISQIDLAWASSTDDFLLSGYHVWRDDVHIATTTIATYSDTSLLPSTSYTYYVTAFDSSFNISASSTPVSATTLSIPPTTPTATSSRGALYGTRIPPPSEQIISLEILPQKDAVTIHYTTDGHVRSIVKWGKTSSYELGSLAEQTFSKSHETTIVGLIPGTKYYFTIEGENKIGRYGAMYTGMFITLQPEDTFPPGNVTNLSAVKEGNDVVLSWVNPKDVDLAKIRVVRSDIFYPSDSADGWVVYEGLGNSMRDTGVVASEKWHYYTVFSYDALGNVSSGAVVNISPNIKNNEKEVVPEIKIDPTQNGISLNFNTLLFTQEGNSITAVHEVVRIDGSKQLTIALPYTVLPEHLKTILVVMRDRTNPEYTFQFLLRVNKEKTAYVSTLAPFGVSGDFAIEVSVFDFKTAQIGYAQGILISYITPTHTEPEAFNPVEDETFFFSRTGGLYTIVFILLLASLLFLGQRLMRAKW